jgi:hypothetical protein
MSGKRVTNFERRLQELEEQEAARDEPRGILELFDRDEDAPLARDHETTEQHE